MAYEDGMLIAFDPSNSSAIVVFRDELAILSPFHNKVAAYQAGEHYCRDHGWIEATKGPFLD